MFPKFLLNFPQNVKLDGNSRKFYNMFEDKQVDDNILLNMSCEKLEFVWNIEIISKLFTIKSSAETQRG